MVLQQTSAKMLQEGTDTQALDVLLETIVQVNITQSRDLLNQESIGVVSHLVEAFVADQKDSQSDVQSSDYAFTIELASQLCMQTL